MLMRVCDVCMPVRVKEKGREGGRGERERERERRGRGRGREREGGGGVGRLSVREHVSAVLALSHRPVRSPCWPGSAFLLIIRVNPKAAPLGGV